MTSKQIYEATAIELSKVQAPTLKLYEFNYFFNQAIRQYVNKIYNIYDINQQTTDDLRVLKSTATLEPKAANLTGNKAIDYLRRGTYFVDMPDDYLHLLNCICLFNVNRRKDCWNKDDVMVVGAKKLTADSWSNITDDVYNRPTKKQPYYYIHNQNDIFIDNGKLSDRNGQLPTNSETDTLHDEYHGLWNRIIKSAQKEAFDSGATKDTVYTVVIAYAGNNSELIQIINDINSDVTITTPVQFYEALLSVNLFVPNFDRTFEFDVDGPRSSAFDTFSSVEKPAGSRYSNSSKVRIEIRCGSDTSNVFDLAAVQIDYVKAPQHIRLTQEQLDSDEDISQIMEFPDYVNQEIINELVNLIMRKTNDPSLQAHLQMTQSIARPTGQSQQTAAQA